MPNLDSSNLRIWGGLPFVRVPAGEFVMGSAADNQRAIPDERPQHMVVIPYDYWIGRYPVTNAQFAEFVAATNYKFDQGQWLAKTNHPVVNVTWRDALAYCQWLNDTLRGELKDLTLRLPTEAEWEKAARGTQGNEWPWGNNLDQNKCNSLKGNTFGTTPVNTYSPQGDSPYGCADMAGNVWEWCHSIFKLYPYQTFDGRENEAGDELRVVRGGSWGDDNRNCTRCAYRSYGHPNFRFVFTGFRCVLSLALAGAKYPDPSAAR